jgi:hypothetical protein
LYELNLKIEDLKREEGCSYSVIIVKNDNPVPPLSLRMRFLNSTREREIGRQIVIKDRKLGRGL